MKRRIPGLLLVALLLLGIATASAQAPAPTTPAAAPASTPVKARQLTVTNKPFTGDFDAMLERRIIRVYAPYSRSLYFIDKGRERGLGAELVRDFERWVNQKYAKELGKRPLTDLHRRRDARQAADRSHRTAWRTSRSATSPSRRSARRSSTSSRPTTRSSTSRSSSRVRPRPPIAHRSTICPARRVHVRKASSYYESLSALNEQLRARRQARDQRSSSCPTRSRTRTCSRC